MPSFVVLESLCSVASRSLFEASAIASCSAIWIWCTKIVAAYSFLAIEPSSKRYQRYWYIWLNHHLAIYCWACDSWLLTHSLIVALSWLLLRLVRSSYDEATVVVCYYQSWPHDKPKIYCLWCLWYFFSHVCFFSSLGSKATWRVPLGVWKSFYISPLWCICKCVLAS